MKRTALVTLLTLCLTLPVLAQTTLTVDKSGSCSDNPADGLPYCTIEAAVDDASNGDTVDVEGSSGLDPAVVYNETIIVDDEDLTISSDDANAPVVDPPGTQTAIALLPEIDWCINPSSIALPPKSPKAVDRSVVTVENLHLYDSHWGPSWNGIRINGDDTIVLRKYTNSGSSVVDVIGQVGADPGNEWGTGGNSTNRANLRRDTCTRDTNPGDAFDPAANYAGTALHMVNNVAPPIADWNDPPNDGDPGDAAINCSAGGEVMFSQYVESYGMSHGVEIWNPTGGGIVLDDGSTRYVLEVYSQGSDCPGQVVPLSGTIAANSVVTVGNNSSTMGITTTASTGGGSTNLPVTNASFEDQVLADGSSTNTVEDWTVTGGSAGVINPAPGNLDCCPAGNNLAFVTGSTTTTISQTLSSTLRGDVDYELEVGVGNPSNDPGFGTYTISLWAGGTQLASLIGNPLGEGRYGRLEIVYKAPPDHPNLGDPLQIRLTANASDGDVYFDDVRLRARSYSNDYGDSIYGAAYLHDSDLNLVGVELSESGQIESERGNLSITASNLHNNQGVVNAEGGSLSVADSTFTNNSNYAIEDFKADIEVTNSLFEFNAGSFLTENSSLVIRDTTIRNNTSRPIDSDNSDVTITGSTISNNAGNCCDGGAIYSEHLGLLDITNSTISGNSVTDYGGGIYLLGRGNLEHVTLYNNTAGTDGSQVYVWPSPLEPGDFDYGETVEGPAGAIDNLEEPEDQFPAAGVRCVYLSYIGGGAPDCYMGLGTLTYRNTVIAATVATTSPCAFGTESTAAGSFDGQYNSLGHNYIYPADPDCGADQATDDDDGGQAPMLDVLADNGGPTETHEPLPGSPLIDAGVLTENFDQRGVFRPQGADSDIGSVETTGTPGYVQGIKTAEGTFEVGQTVTYTIVLTNYGECVQPNDPDEDEFTDVVPSQIDVTGASADSGTTSVNGNTVTWNGSVAIDGNVTITITGTIVAGGTISNTGSVNVDTDCDGDNDTIFTTGSPAGPGPTNIIVPAVSAEIPTLSWTMMLLLAFALAGVAVVVFRRVG